jgi:hypothetical protein
MTPEQREQAIESLTREIIDGLSQLWNKIRARKAAQVALDSRTFAALIAAARREGAEQALRDAVADMTARSAAGIGIRNWLIARADNIAEGDKDA